MEASCLDLPLHNDNRPCTYLGHPGHVTFELELVGIQTFWEPPRAAAIANPLERFKVRSLSTYLGSVPLIFYIYIYLPTYNDSNYHAHSGHSQSVRAAYAVRFKISYASFMDNNMFRALQMNIVFIIRLQPLEPYLCLLFVSIRIYPYKVSNRL